MPAFSSRSTISTTACASPAAGIRSTCTDPPASKRVSGSAGSAPSDRVERRGSPWRRYYSVRNHIVIMRRYTTWPSAVFVTLAHLCGRPVMELVRRQPGRVALIRASTRGCVDAWRGRLGRQMEPGPGADQRPRP